MVAARFAENMRVNVFDVDVPQFGTVLRRFVHRISATIDAVSGIEAQANWSAAEHIKEASHFAWSLDKRCDMGVKDQTQSKFLGGAYDIVVQRVVDAWMSFPALVVVLSLMAVLGPGLPNLILALSILGAASASRVIRGGSLLYDPQDARSACRSGSAPGYRRNNLGFRLARVPSGR